MRKYYCTAVQGDYPLVDDIEKKLKLLGMETPRVFKKGKPSKRLDITLATDMLLHATRKHYDVAVLVAGDEDYVPLVRAVQGEGARVYVWFLPDGLSPALDTYRPWAELLKRTFDFDVLSCPNCGGRMKFLALITDEKSVARCVRKWARNRDEAHQCGPSFPSALD